MGKGTSPEDGEALLAAVTEDLLERGPESCPLTLLSTHFHGVVGLLGERPLLNHFSMKTRKERDGSLTYLFKLEEGAPDSSSEALAVASRVGLSAPLLRGQRSLQLVGLRGFVQKECLSTTFMDSWRGFSILTPTAEKMWSCYWKQLVNYIILEIRPLVIAVLSRFHVA